MTLPLLPKRYIGDAVYVDFNGYQIILTTEDGISVTNTIALETEVLESLDDYREDLRKAVEARLAELEK